MPAGSRSRVLGCGIDRDYPAAHRDLASRIAERGPDRLGVRAGRRAGSVALPGPEPDHRRPLPATVVVEARERSGALITADFALEDGREVMVVPGEITSAVSAGSNALLRLGATPVTAAADVLEVYGIEPSAEAAEAPGGLGGMLLERLAESPASIDELARALRHRSRRGRRRADRARARGPDQRGRRRLPGHDRAVRRRRRHGGRRPVPITIRACSTTTTRLRAPFVSARRGGRSRWLSRRSARSRPSRLRRPRTPRQTGRSPSSSCRRSNPRRTPIEARSGCSCPAPARPSRASGRSPPSCAAGSCRRSSISTGSRSCGSQTRPPRRRSTSPCRRRAPITTSCAIPSRSSGRATAACSRRARRGSTGSSRSPTSRRPRRRSPPGRTPPIRARADSRRGATLARLDVRLARAHDARTGATLVLVGWLVAFAAARDPRRLGDRRSGRRARRAGGARDGSAAARGRRRRPLDGRRRARARHRGRIAAARRSGARLLVPAVVCFLVAFLVDPGRLAGGQRAGGDRAASRRRRPVLRRHEPGRDAAARPVARRSGAGRRRGCRRDRAPAPRHGRVEPGRGGRRRAPRRRCGVRGARSPGSRACGSRPLRVVAGIAAVLALGLAIVGVDALLGGSSHVTDAVGGGPGTLFDDLDRRLRISWAGATSAAHTTFLCLLSLGGLAWLGIRGRRAAGDRGDARRHRRLARGQRHARGRARLRGARLPRADGLGGDPRARARSASAARLRAAFQSRKSALRIDGQVEAHDPGARRREAHGSVRALREAARARCASTATSSSRCGSGRDGRGRR